MRVRLIYNRIPHHAGHSGYDQLVRYLVGRVEVELLEGDVPRMIPWRAWEVIVERSSGWIADHAGMDWYDPYSLMLEMRAAARLVRRNGEIYHILYGENTYRYLGLLGSVAKRKGSGIVCTYHQPPEIFERVVKCKQILKRLDAIVVVASTQAEYFASLLDPERVFVVPHGIDTEFYRPAERGDSSGEACLFVGQWLRDFDMLRAVIERVGATDRRIKFTVVTGEENAALLEGFENVIVKRSVSDAELLETYQHSDMLVLPLRDCTANNSLLEALACGLPIVTTDVGGIKDYVDPTCAVIVPPKDVDSMCDAIVRLSSDDGWRLRMGQRSRRRAMAFDWSQVAERLTNVYETVARWKPLRRWVDRWRP